MLNHPTYEKLKQLRFTGMLVALAEHAQNSEIEALSFEESLGLLVDRELDERETRRLKRRLKQSRLSQEASALRPVHFASDPPSRLNRIDRPSWSE